MTVDKQGTWPALIADNGDLLRRFIARRVAHRWDTQDLIQEVYLRILRAQNGTDTDIRHPKAYLFTIAANLIKERSLSASRMSTGEESLDDILDRLATPCDAEASIDRDLRRERLATLLSRLSPKCRAVLIMHYRDELPYRDIAERLSISTNMVKKYVVKGLAACREGMSRYE
ncbi:RNA polymerase sigma-70 factor (ECF subfamily) [Luteibacter sp. Sphag1AF]|uniref:sigma-70 family RNA polymerase sigma factor n=1 Tax=Luteibacter sp. Sphag1AF TaxID=2587031 RepID=UPI00161B6B61|nr:RNA polymerase sigma-70 factor (ECF subfamily) [Luteibacter sp. Sphag1AF]